MQLQENPYWVLFSTYLAPFRKRVMLLALLVLTTIGLKLVTPQLIRLFIDTAVSSENSSGQLMTYALLFIGGAVVLQVVGVAATFVGEDVGWLATNQMRADVTRHCLHLDMGFHHRFTAGKMIERIDGDIADIAIFFSQFVLRILGNGLLLIGVIIVLLWVDWRISLALLLYSCVVLVGFGLLRRIAVPAMKAIRESNAELFGFLEEQLAGTEDTRSSGAVDYVMRRLFLLSRRRFGVEVAAAEKITIVFGTWFSLATVGRGLSLVLGFLLFRNGSMTLGSVYLVIHYMNLILDPLRQIVKQIDNFQKSAASIDRVYDLIKEASAIVAVDKDALDLPHEALGIRFSEVGFGYRPDEPVLEDIDFALEPGEVLGILGRTGSGKTTLTRLLFRLYDVDEGAILLGDNNGRFTPITATTLSDLRQQVGMVTQDVQLFQASVRDNLTFFDATISDEHILQVIYDLELRDWYDTLPHGLDTMLQTEGASLSAGEGQLLAFTRVFLKNPGVVILDEASSRLDPATERLIERAVDKLLAERTGIIVAHRLGTVARADKIMIIENGRIHEFGPYDQLASDPTSRFHQLLQAGAAEALA